MRSASLLACLLVLSASPSAGGAQITLIIDPSGDGENELGCPIGIAVDASGNVYVTGRDSNNSFRITSGGSITQILDASGDGAGNVLAGPSGIAVDSSGNVYCC